MDETRMHSGNTLERLAFPLIATGLFLLPAASALANMPMFFMIAFTKVSYWWTILLAIAIEAAAIHWIFKLPWIRAAIASVAVNVATLALGIVLYPFVGSMLYPSLAPAVTDLTGGGWFAELAATLLGTSVIDAVVELAILMLVFKALMAWSRAALFFVANVATAGILFGAMTLSSLPERLPQEEVDQVLQVFAPEIRFMHDLLDELPQRLRPMENIPNLNEFDPDWARSKRSEADSLRFHELWIHGPGRSFNLQDPAFPQRRTLGARYSGEDFEVSRGAEFISEQDEQGTVVYLYSIERAANGDTFEVDGLFEAP
jgi:hypothetical protein